MRQKSKYFQSLYRQYRRTPLSAGGRHELYQRMVANAESFSEWAIVYQLGDGCYQYDALENMKSTVFDECKPLDIQMNILELFEIVTDDSEQQEILEKYLLRFTEKDDLLFVMALSHGGAVHDKAEKKAAEYYSSLGILYRGVTLKQERLKKMMSKSTFMLPLV